MERPPSSREADNRARETRAQRSLCALGSTRCCGLLTRCEEEWEDVRVLWVLMSKAAVTNIPEPGAEAREPPGGTMKGILILQFVYTIKPRRTEKGQTALL